ncbi:MAG: hypothetical protein JO182_28295 [Acidobacteriaceae bacterium]|nr:hypothetical protein [Acidobacteriaceae bacterium]
MAASPYETAVRAFEALSPKDQAKLLMEISGRVRSRELSSKQRNILELQGLGKEVWEGVDAQEYVRNERASWDG